MQITNQKIFPCNMFQLKKEILYCSAGIFQKKEQFYNGFYGNFRNFTGICFPLEKYLWQNFQIHTRLQFYQKTIPLNTFSRCFPKFSVQLFQNSLMKTPLMEFRRVRCCRLYTSAKSEKGRFFGIRVAPQKACNELLLWISKNIRIPQTLPFRLF